MRSPRPLAKTTRPSFKGVLPRPRLFRLFDRGGSRSVLWVTGPPGSGKTTVVASYLQARRLPALWYQVDEGDGDVASFFHYMGLAARQAAPRIRRPLPALTPEYRQELSTFTRRYFRDLYGRLGARFAVVLDHYDRAPGDSLLHDVIRDALEELPESGRAIVISRVGPPSSVARLSANRSLEVIGWDTLRWTRAEWRGLARVRGSRPWPQRTLDELHARMEGWVAGLVLVLERIGDGGAPDEILQHGASEATFDYFAEEILKKMDQPAQRFLLETALLPTMTASMAASLTGSRQADRFLSELSRRNYFTEKRSALEPAYQYHPLFRDFLLERGRETLPPARLQRLRQRAARILAGAGEVESAALLLREARAWPALVRLILDQAPTLLGQGRSRTLQDWIEALPGPLAEESAWLQYWLGACRLPTDPAGSRGHFERAYQAFRGAGERAGALQAWCGVVESIQVQWEDFTLLDPWIQALDDLLEESRAFPSPMIEARVAFGMFSALMFRQPHHPYIETWAERALALAQPDVAQRVITGSFVVLFSLWRGDLARAGRIVTGLRQDPAVRQAPPLAWLNWKANEATYYWNVAEPEACLRAVSEGLEAARASGVRVWDYLLLGQGVYGALAGGDLGTARDYLDRMAAVVVETRRLDLSHYHFLSSWHASLRGETEAALRHGELALKLALEAGTPFPVALNHVAMARLLHDQGREAEAQEHLGRARRLADGMKSQYVSLMALFTEAHLALDRGDEAAGLASLRRAMGLGRRLRFVNTAWWRPGVMARLCATALEAGIEVEYARELVRRRGLVPETPPADVERWPWPVKLETLGAFALVLDGAPGPPTRKLHGKPGLLLKALVALGGREVPEARLADLLWPEAEGDVARQDLRVTVHRLRRLLQRDDAVIVQGGALSLNPQACWVDAWAFEGLLRRAEAADRRGDAGQATALSERALGHYRGPFLGGERDAPWAVVLRERLRSRFLRAVIALGQRWERAGDWPRAAEWYERGLEVEDLAEELYQRLMVCLERQGRRADALGVYERCRRTLAATLGVAPSAATEALRRAAQSG